ncbi:MAG TPA: hypothetical protein VM577_15795 [Anaerovoracaceae bacterium]|nr:hypothetical protein [Anaerovoracaceae bacterium]
MLNVEESKEDYSEIEGSRISEGTILPFVIELDAEDSNLYPTNNENQRFCYSVTGIGTENSKFEDLSHLVLGICDQILQNEIANISVRIDGVEQDVGLEAGGSVQLTARQNSDRISEYPGLKFDINLDKTHGKMCFSFELTHPYPIGRNKVYLVGNNAVMNEVSTYGPVSQELQDGYIHAYQNASVYIPVEITPRTDSGEIKTSCCGEPTVTFHEDRGSSKYCFTIIQPICMEVPLEFSAEALLGSLHVKCGEEGDTGCKPVCEETDTGCKPVCEETCEVSSSEQEQLKPSLPKNHYYKVFF